LTGKGRRPGKQTVFLHLNAAAESLPGVITEDWDGSLSDDWAGIHIVQHFVHRAASHGHA